MSVQKQGRTPSWTGLGVGTDRQEKLEQQLPAWLQGTWAAARLHVDRPYRGHARGGAPEGRSPRTLPLAPSVGSAQ
ncbi:hypothetical protein [Myxococcus vastator]|uniref:hypothetical protein n=1 Tax=Myxococcus vastator TaxID=2709664 RepID=UPI0013D71138|nr:hypothetical protein [Myxococcus vastator]